MTKKLIKKKQTTPPRKVVGTKPRKGPAVKQAVRSAPRPVVKQGVKHALKSEPAKKSAPQSAPLKKPAPRPAHPSKQPVPMKAVAGKPPVKKNLPARPATPVKVSMTRKELEDFRKRLLTMRDSIVDEISFLAGENLNKSQREASGDLSNYGMHMADQGTDNFDREFALNLVSNEQNVLYEIDEALQRIENRTFGLCEQTGLPIEKERLKVLPYTRLSLVAQEELERKNKRRRPFNGGTSFGSGNQDY
jgi:RNA polymerase-binding transcription factor DksA